MSLSSFKKIPLIFVHLNDRLKGRAFRIFSDFMRLSLAAWGVILLMRLGQFLFLSYNHTLPLNSLWPECQGFFQDVVLWQFISWALFLPFFILSYFRRWIGVLFYGIFFIPVLLAEWSLFQYFSITLRPLDQVIFSYSIREMKMIAGSCVKFDLFTFLPFMVLILLTVFLTFLTFKLRFSKYSLVFLIFFSILPPFFIKAVIPEENRTSDSFEYFLRVNKSSYFLEKVLQYSSASKQSISQFTVEAASKRYHAMHPEFDFLGSRYPFLHDDHTPDVLGDFFYLGNEKPNLVFIIVESLSSCFMGNNLIFGDFTPFLDSLAQHSLYWNNFLSTADRTFNVLPAMFASLPPGDPTFIREVSRIPYHLSMPRYLREQGYYTSFFYGGDPAFNYMEDFLRRQETDYILHDFGSKYKKSIVNQGYSWGYSDGDLFNRSFEVMDSFPRSPRLDIYLTLSLHTPFIPPDQAYFLSLVDKRLKEISPGFKNRDDIEKNKNIFSTIFYTDHSLRMFFKNYRKRPEYKNTIFIITGDHGLPELNLARFSGLERFRVPLIVFSPLLKKPAFFRSVSSHLDVTPTFLAMLQKRYGLEALPVVPWLGSGIDTAVTPRNLHTLPFILNNKEIVDYINHSYYFNQGGVRIVQPELLLRDTADAGIRKRLERELSDFKVLNTYVTKQNKLIPPELIFHKMIDSAVIAVHDSLFFNSLDSTGEFRSFFNQLVFDSKFRFLKLEVRVNFLTSETDLRKAPILVFDLYRKNGKHVLWQSFDFPCHELKPVKPGEWRTILIQGSVDLSYLNGKEPYSLMLYIWNRARCIVRFDKPSVKITGYY